MHAERIAYWSVFVTAFLAVAIWESVCPWRKLRNAAERRWANHGALFAVSMVCSLPFQRLGVVALAALAARSPLGLLNQPWMPAALRWAGALLLLDLVRYGAHWGFHRAGWLWRVHEVHHSDPDYDVSTAVRFHPLEVIGGQALYLGAVAALAAPPSAVLTSELLSAALNISTHANASLPAWAERALRTVFITPDLHRIHHSEETAEQGTNFGQTFTFWDRLFGTYREQPAGGSEKLITGLRGFQVSSSLGVGFMLGEPFRSQPPSATPALPQTGLES